MQSEDQQENKAILLEKTLNEFKTYLLRTSALFLDYPEQSHS